jgi:hypothetical protein
MLDKPRQVLLKRALQGQGSKQFVGGSTLQNSLPVVGQGPSTSATFSQKTRADVLESLERLVVSATIRFGLGTAVVDPADLLLSRLAAVFSAGSMGSVAMSEMPASCWGEHPITSCGKA